VIHHGLFRHEDDLVGFLAGNLGRHSGVTRFEISVVLRVLMRYWTPRGRDAPDVAAMTDRRSMGELWVNQNPSGDVSGVGRGSPARSRWLPEGRRRGCALVTARREGGSEVR
jgi:hypothetical protein